MKETTGTNHHVPIPWSDTIESGQGTLAKFATLSDKTSIICRMGGLMLRTGAGGWRVRDTVNRVARALGVTATVNLGLTDIECTVRSGSDQRSQVIVIPDSGVNVDMLMSINDFLSEIDDRGDELTVQDFHKRMNQIKAKKVLYSPAISGLASAFACGAFTFLLGGGLIEMLCAFIGAGLGQFTRRMILKNKINQLLAMAAGTAVACVAYLLALMALEFVYPEAHLHQMGYIAAMLFVIPGFPLITAALDMFLFDMRSGIERLTYACITIVVATLIGWMVATILTLQPDEFYAYTLPEWSMALLRLCAAFVGVFGFSIMFNSPIKVAATAGLIGAIADTVNLELVKYFGFQAEFGAFIGALIAGLLASAAWKALKYPRTAITVPSVVIMIPGLYMYQSMYYLATFEVTDGIFFLMRAVMVVICLPCGLILARAFTDPHWRHTS